MSEWLQNPTSPNEAETLEATVLPDMTIELPPTNDDPSRRFLVVERKAMAQKGLFLRCQDLNAPDQPQVVLHICRGTTEHCKVAWSGKELVIHSHQFKLVPPSASSALPAGPTPPSQNPEAHDHTFPSRV